MFSHAIVYVILSILSATAVYAAGAPLGKLSQEKVEPGSDDQGATDDKDSMCTL